MFHGWPFISVSVSIPFQVGPQSTVVRTQCLCNHLTYFGSDFFIVPRTVNVEDTIKLFLRVTSNPVGVSLLASLLGFYMLLFVWARRKDQADMQKVRRLLIPKVLPQRLEYVEEGGEKYLHPKRQVPWFQVAEKFKREYS